MQTELLIKPTNYGPQTAKRPGLVLVVDDEEPNRLLLRDPLEARGLHVDEAENGIEALQKVAQQRPDVILLDVMMPRMDGFEVCERLKKDPHTASIPVLMVTALSERKERLMGIKAGATDFLKKPVDLLEVMLRVDNAIYTKHLMDDLQAEQRKSDRLLLNILPKPIAERMKSGEANIADAYPEATVLFTDLVGFTTLSANIGPAEIVLLLNEIYTTFDAQTESLGLEKIKTIGDAYMAAGGIPGARPDHAEAVTELALKMRQCIDVFNIQYNTSIYMRTGICSGPIIAGVIGRKKFAYDLWGDTVNAASRLAAIGEPGEIIAAESTFQLIKNNLNVDKFRFKEKQKVEVKGLGELSIHSL